ncbi:Peroxisome biogenesis 5 [Micractinium conductrix]|uniref:Peroxisome biogenesis 5 n=1 Tax=Micractinium conductrix TaxID=554055 RepID=A0A2P6VIN4_9CHLO|nr:Peroxisome biogenesis 5 [Micractinium conductrix]|eukprot:PSC73938.1 Peroxisome biogenesis 5 [Micractinium conductrix]
MPARDHVDAFLRGLPPGAAAPHGQFAEFESIYAAQAAQGRFVPPPPGAAALPPALAAQARDAAAPMLQAFVHSSSARAPFAAPMAPPGLALSLADQRRIRDRGTIMARQLFADRGPEFADQQVERLLASLNIDPRQLPAGGQEASFDAIFAAAAPRGLAHPSMLGEHAAAAAAVAAAAERGAAAAGHAQQAQWAQEFERLRLGEAGPSSAASWAAEYQAGQQQGQPPGAWAEEFSAGEQQGAAAEIGSTGWVNEFRSTAAAGTDMRQRAAAGDAMQQTRQLADTLAASADPKIRNSQFLQFVSKMSRGELILEDNAVKEVPREAAAWASEFGSQQAAQPSVWGDEFAAFQAGQHPAAAGAQWAQDFVVKEGRPDWADEFADGVVGGGQWAQEFREGAASTDIASWEEEYMAELERVHGSQGPRAAGGYVFADPNPFLLDTDSLAKGKDLFRRGVLTEAVIALEAECQRNPGNAEAWRLLGTVQAENDDDQQAIAAMNRALGADPSDLDVLLSLGVSHTNELEQGEALSHLRQWVVRHPRHAPASQAVPDPGDPSQTAAYVAALFEAAARARPEDAELHSALGVVYNLARRYDDAVVAFQEALRLQPADYSLWNKLGATLANSSRSSEAIGAYQKALDLKPNYMRAWTNLGISLANLADYEGSARYYVRALALNPRASAVWGYLRTSLTCAGREELLGAADSEDLAALQAALPLE